MNRYLVVKCGGSICDQLSPAFFKSLRTIQEQGVWRPVVVHGGGPAISAMLEKLKIPAAFHHGLRVTSQAALDVAEMVLSGTLNKRLVSQIEAVGGKAVGLSGIDGGLIQAQALAQAELGYVGAVRSVNASLLTALCDRGYVPVISPIAMDDGGQHYNINADHVAAALAAALGGSLCLVSDVPGILVEQDGKPVRLKQVSDQDIEQMIDSQTISGGMIPKVRAAVASLKQKVPEVVIVNGKVPECLIDYTQGADVGTKIFLEEETVHA